MTTKFFRMNRYLSLFRTPPWTKASIGADAPMNNLQFIYDMMDYKEIDKEVANVILSKITNHRWYLTEEVVPSAFFSKHVRRKICQPNSWKFQYPKIFVLVSQLFVKSLVKQVSQIFWGLDITHCSVFLASIQIGLLNQLNSGQSNQEIKKLKNLFVR